MQSPNKTAEQQLQEIEEELSGLPDAFLVYKTIHGRKQPYLQWHEDGKTKSRYVKLEERERVLMEIERRDQLLLQKKRLLSYHSALQEAWKKYPSLHTQNHLTDPVGIGYQYFAEMMEEHLFYVDKSMFIREWWEDHTKVNLITRPRRFGKSLNLDMLDCFFSDRYRNRKDLFENLQIWDCRDYRKLQGTFPVIHLDFSNMKTGSADETRTQLTQAVLYEFYKHGLLATGEWRIDESWTITQLEAELLGLCRRLSEQSNGKNVIILIDEYDTPIQEAWGKKDYQEVLELMRMVFHTLLKGNPYLEKALLTGITRVSRESLFSDLNNLKVSSVMNNEYAEYFGFTEEEVFASMDSQSLQAHEEVKRWYDGFTIGNHHDIYNPWSVTNYLKTGILNTYWANTSSNSLVGKMVSSASPAFKNKFLQLMNGQSIEVTLKENLIWEDLEREESQIWGLLLATGYITGTCQNMQARSYQIYITNYEVMQMFEELFLRWFSGNTHEDYTAFQQAMFRGDAEIMTEALNEIMLETFSYFDVSGTSEKRKTENFYHGFVLGLVASLRKDYLVTSNRESGYGRYDVMIKPRAQTGTAVILEFKVSSRESGSTLSQTAENALQQILDKAYTQQLQSEGIPAEQILTYGIAFCGKQAHVKTGTGG